MVMNATTPSRSTRAPSVPCARAGMRLGGVTAVVALLLVGCPEVDNPYRAPPSPNFETFVSDVQPVLGARCSYLPCHGAPERTFTVYAVGFLRAVSEIPGTPLSEHGLSEAELHWNYDTMRYRLIDETSADEARVLLKCLAPAAGGIEHAGGLVVFESTSDPDYVTIRNWLAEGLD